jgi:SNF2 family DNA or RNA helicase
VRLWRHLTPYRPAKGKTENYRRLAEIGLYLDARVQTSETLAQERFIVPGKLRLETRIDATTGALSLVPVPDGLEPDTEAAFLEQFRREGASNGFYDLRTADGGRVRIALSEPMRAAVTHARRHLQHLTGPEKDRMVFGGPAAEFEALSDEADDNPVLNCLSFGERVLGIGPYAFAPVPRLKRPEDVSMLPPDWSNDEPDKGRPYLDAVDPNGSPVEIPFRNEEHLVSTTEAIERALREGSPSVIVEGADGARHIIEPRPKLLDALKDLLDAYRKEQEPDNSSKSSHEKEASKKFGPLIAKNDDALEYIEGAPSDEEALASIDPADFQRPHALKDTLNGQSFDLKDYQKQGVIWLRDCQQAGKPGVLLADDMGLGKTLQVLTFLADYIERQPDLFPDKGPYPRPILIVAPLILLPNWESEIKKFFKNEGATFLPFVRIEAATLKHFRRPGQSGQDTANAGSEPMLMPSRFQENRLVIANYDTVKNYAKSFGQVDWSVIVADEVQEIKTPDTAVTHALKAVGGRKGSFKIALSGTPIENTLSDLWSIMDFAAPGELLGSQKAFRESYEAENNVQALKERLHFGQGRAAYVLGRMKEDYLKAELPARTPVDAIAVPYRLGEQEWQLHLNILEAARRSSKKGRHLTVLQRLRRLYLHPALLSEQWRDASLDELLTQSSKFWALDETLKEVRRKGEKALIFIRSLHMQQLACRLLTERYGLSEPLTINGQEGKRTGEGSRQSILERFKEAPGFAAIILSPEVAGVGLNIVEANHVIHYERWWNPALEDQATCRAYRLGQTRYVHVVCPVAQSPDGTKTFEERLHELLAYKSALRKDFLTPTAEGEITGKELLNEILGEETAPNAPDIILNTQDVQALDGFAFEAYIAAYFMKRGAKAILTPRTGDYGADVVVIEDDRKATLVQCKKGPLDENALDDLKRAHDAYKTYLAGYVFDYLAVTAQPRKSLGAAQRQAGDIRLWGLEDLDMKCYPISYVDMELAEQNRLSSLSGLSV